MKEQIEMQNLIRSNLDQIKIKNPGYSLRAYARKLELSPSALSEILNGKRKISQKMAARILDRMNLSPEITAPVLNLFGKTKSLDFMESDIEPDLPTPTPIDFLQLSSDQFNLIAEWQHFAVLSLMETKNFKSDISWIARKLNITIPQANASIERLIRLGFVFQKNKKFVTNKRALLTSDNIPNQAVRKSHYGDLNLAEKALDHIPVESRDFTSITIAANKNNIVKARKLIREFQDKLTLCLEQGEKDEVLKFSFYLYPLTQTTED